MGRDWTNWLVRGAAMALAALVVAAGPAAAVNPQGAGCVAVDTLTDEDLSHIIRELWGGGNSAMDECLMALAFERVGLLERADLAPGVPALSGAAASFAQSQGISGVDAPEFPTRLADHLLAVRAEKGPQFQAFDESRTAAGWADVRGVARQDDPPQFDERAPDPAQASIAALPDTAQTPPPGDCTGYNGTLGTGPTLDGCPVNAGRIAAPPAPPPEIAILREEARALRGLPDRCLDLASQREPDVRANLDVFGNARICMTRESVSERGRPAPWSFSVFENLDAPDGPVWFLPHDNENAAFTAAVHAIVRYGGKFVAVNARESRNFGPIDPNRNFGATRDERAACRLRAPAPAYTQFVMRHFGGRREALTLHNNTNGGGVTANVNNGKETGLLALTNVGLGDPDHLVYVTSDRRYGRDPAVSAEIERLRRAGLNVVHEYVRPGNNDCSLSNYIALKYPSMKYYNVEAQHRYSKAQRQMVDIMMQTLGYPAIARGS
ncbi:MAG: hypothetical protein AAF318_03950 [Pseudomonadota bacterium]